MRNGTLHVLSAADLRCAAGLSEGRLGSNSYVDLYYNDEKIGATQVLSVSLALSRALARAHARVLSPL